MLSLRRLAQADSAQSREFRIAHWEGEEMIVHGEGIRYDQVEGFIAGDWLGLLTYLPRGDECEIISLDSLEVGQGIGTALTNTVSSKARQRNCSCLSVTTTNYNLQALGFYPRRGFKLNVLRPEAVPVARKLKPAIPLNGENNIPLPDEIELERLL